MTRTFLVLSAILLVSAPMFAQESIEFFTADSVHVFGDLYVSETDDAPIILLFHQAGANGPAEYGAIIPKLLDEGYSILSIDQRSGGSRFGGTNRTVEANGGQSSGYCEAASDLEATVDYVVARGLGGPVIVWGSSYSAGLVIRLAVSHPETVDAILAFSPASGGPMAGCSPDEVAGKVEQPLLVLRPASEMENESVASQLKQFKSEGHVTYIAKDGVHGSSMLNAERTGHSTDDTWEVVLTFLSSLR